MSRNYLPDSIYTICGEFTQDCNNCYNQKWSPIVNGIVHDSQRGKVFCPFGSGNSMNTPIFGEQIKLNNKNLEIDPKWGNTTWGRAPQLTPRSLSRIGLEWRSS